MFGLTESVEELGGTPFVSFKSNTVISGLEAIQVKSPNNPFIPSIWLD